jgi:hypothetical protein
MIRPIEIPSIEIAHGMSLRILQLPTRLKRGRLSNPRSANPVRKAGSIVQGHESMAGMGRVSRAYDKLPDWVKLTLGVCAIVAIVYGTAREGWVFLLKVILSP